MVAAQADIMNQCPEIFRFAGHGHCAAGKCRAMRRQHRKPSFRIGMDFAATHAITSLPCRRPIVRGACLGSIEKQTRQICKAGISYTSAAGRLCAIGSKQ
ncbi:MAG: hypothetical protein ACRYF5_13730 [Janthinobacterium lividum]